MKLKKGMIISLKFEERKGGIMREHKEQYEVVRAGSLAYLFCNATGHDWYATRTEIEEAIENFKNINL